MERVVIPILIKNNNLEEFHPDPLEEIVLSYEWLRPGEDSSSNPIPSALLTSPIPPCSSNQVMLLIKAPEIEGKYLLRIILTQAEHGQIGRREMHNIVITCNQKRYYADLCNMAIKIGNFGDALRYFKKDRESFGADDTSEEAFICKIVSTKEWCQTYSLPYKSLKETVHWQVPSPLRLGKSGPGKYAWNETLPEWYVAEVYDATVIGGHDPVFVGNHVALLDVVAPGRDFSNYQNQGYNYFYDGVVNFEITDALILQLLQKPEMRTGEDILEGIFLCGMYTDNYFHWVVENLPIFWAIDQCPEYDQTPIIVNKTLPQKFLEILAIFNNKQRKLIFVDYGVKYKVKNLIIPSKFSYEYMKGETVSPVSIKFLKDRIGGKFKKDEKIPKKRIYIQRNEPEYRKLLNEKEFEYLFKQYGFEFIDPSKLSIFEQIDLFSSAEILAGPHGAGWTNMIFAPSDARGLMLLGPELSYLYSNIANIIGQELIHIHGQSIQKTYIQHQFQSDYVINVDEVETALEALVGNDKKSNGKEPESTINSGILTEIQDHTDFYVDLINGKNVSDSKIIINQDSEKQVIIQGWAIDSNARAPAAAVFLTFDTGQEYRAYYTLMRSDVASYFKNEKLKNSGFISIISSKDLPKDFHYFRLKIISSDRKGYYFPSERFYFQIV